MARQYIAKPCYQVVTKGGKAVIILQPNMPIAKVPEEVAQLVRDLSQQDKNSQEIAKLVNLKPVQVSAILASHTLKSTPPQVTQKESESIYADAAATQSSTQPPEEYGIPQALEGDDDTQSADRIYIGDDRDYSDPVYWEPTSIHAVHNPHLMIMGESGSGKTYAVQCLVAELARRGIPSVLFDYGQSFELTHLEEPFKRFTGIREYPLSEEGLPLNPLEIFPKDVHGPKNVATRVSDVFDAAYRLGDIQRKVMIDAIRQAFERVGISETDQKTWISKPPTISDLQAVLDELSSDREYPNYRNATGVGARLATFFMLSSFKSDNVDQPPSMAAGGNGVVTPGCPTCRKRLFTMANFMNHLADDVLPNLINKLSTNQS
jgi:hypothetical protein